MKYIAFAALGLTLAALSGCGGGSPLTLTEDNYNKIQDKMSEADVKAILGAPSSTDSKPIPIVGGPGTAVLFHCKMVHASGHNLSANDRWHVYMAYNPAKNYPNPIPANPRPERLSATCRKTTVSRPI